MPLVDAEVPGALAAVEAAASSVSRRVGDDISESEVDEDEEEWELPEYGLKIGGDLGLLGSSLTRRACGEA